MDERTLGRRRLKDLDPSDRAAALEREALSIRSILDDLLDELDRRRHRAASGMRVTMKIMLPAIAAAVLAAATVVTIFRRQRRRQARGMLFRLARTSRLLAAR